MVKQIVKMARMGVNLKTRGEGLSSKCILKVSGKSRGGDFPQNRNPLKKTRAWLDTFYTAKEAAMGPIVSVRLNTVVGVIQNHFDGL